MFVAVSDTTLVELDPEGTFKGMIKNQGGQRIHRRRQELS